MTRTEHLLSCLAEENCEVGQRVSKALRFGLDEVQASTIHNPKQLNNAERISEEMRDVYAVAVILVEARSITEFRDSIHVEYKRERIEKYMEHAQKTGSLAATQLRNAVDDAMAKLGKYDEQRIK